MQRVLKVRPVYNFFECGKSVKFFNRPHAVLKGLSYAWIFILGECCGRMHLMLNQESKNTTFMANITGMKLMLAFFSVNSRQIAISSCIWDCFTKWYSIHSLHFCFCQAFLGVPYGGVRNYTFLSSRLERIKTCSQQPRNYKLGILV